MTIAEKRRHEQRVYQEHIEQMVASISRGEDGIQVAAQIAAESGVDEKTAYQWYRITEERLESYQRLRVGLVAGLLWTGVLAGVGILAAVFLPTITVAPVVARTVGGVSGIVVVTAMIMVRGARTRATRRWIRREQTEDIE